MSFSRYDEIGGANKPPYALLHIGACRATHCAMGDKNNLVPVMVDKLFLVCNVPLYCLSGLCLGIRLKQQPQSCA